MNNVDGRVETSRDGKQEDTRELNKAGRTKEKGGDGTVTTNSKMQE